MEHIQHFHFLRPALLLLLLPAFGLFIFMLKAKYQQTSWQASINSQLLDYLIDTHDKKPAIYPVIVILIAWIIASIALAGPTFKKVSVPVIQNENALVLLLDLSPSMRAQDVKPSRYERAKFKIIDILTKRDEGLTGLVVFGGDAHIVTPLTDDKRTVINLLDSLSPDIMPKPGSNPEMAFELALKLLKDSDKQTGDIVFLTDGIDKSAYNTLKNINKTNFNTFIWGIGTVQGAPIPDSNGGFIKNQRDGSIIVNKLSDDELNQAASALNALYIPFTQNKSDVQYLYSSLLQTPSDSEQTNSRETNQNFDIWYEHGYFLVFLLLPLAAMSFRRGWLLSIMLVFIIMPTDQTQASVWGNLWLNDNQQAKKALEADNPEQAEKLFQDKRWKALSTYKNQDFEQAQSLLHSLEELTAQDHFNKGNALTKLGRYDEAINAYDLAEKDPNIAPSAKKNKNIAMQLADLEKQEQEQNGDQQEGEDQQNTQKGDQSQENQNADNQQSQSDNENSDSENSDNTKESESGDQNDQNNNDTAQQTEEAQKEADEKQQAALDKKYQQNPDSDDAKESNEENKPLTSQNEDEQNEDEQNPQKQDETAQALQPAQPELTKEELEAAQSLEQWLRRVPDDPAQLMRNKFRSKSRQRDITDRPIFSGEDDPTNRL